MTQPPSRPFEVHKMDFLRDPEQVALYLAESYEEGGEALLQVALRNVAKAQEGGVKAVAEAAGLNRTNLYRALSDKGNPNFATVSRMAKGLGLKMNITFEPLDTART